jgi:hypothetical protein
MNLLERHVVNRRFRFAQPAEEGDGPVFPRAGQRGPLDGCGNLLQAVVMLVVARDPDVSRRGVVRVAMIVMVVMTVMVVMIVMGLMAVPIGALMRRSGNALP